MKTLLITAVTLLSITLSVAQDCSSAEDCFNKGKNTNFESEAFSYYDKAVKLAKSEGYNASYIYLYRGMRFYNMYTPNLKDAEKDFKASIKENPKNIYPYLWLANLYAYKQKDSKKAVDYLTEQMNTLQNNPYLLNERAKINYYAGNTQAASTDFDMANNLLVDDNSLADEATASEIIRWRYTLLKNSKSARFADEQTLKVLEDGIKLAPNDAQLLGDLALAYFDNGNSDKAFEYGKKANAIDKDNIGSLFVAIESLQNQNYWDAATLMWYVDKKNTSNHPLVSFYFASAQWAYCFNQAQNQWANNKEIIRNRLQLTVQYASGTSYDWYAQEANKMLATIDN